MMDYLECDDCTIDHLAYSNLIPMLSTGLTGRDRTEIFEGDIIQTEGRNGERLSIFRVLWNGSNARFEKLREDGQTYELDPFSESLKRVIGNIYENPELLEPTQ